MRERFKNLFPQFGSFWRFSKELEFASFWRWVGLSVLVGVGVLTIAAVAIMASRHDYDYGWRHYQRGRALMEPSPSSGPSRGLILGLSAAAALSGGAGAVLLLTRPSKDAPQAGISLAPGAVMLSGTLP